MKRPTKLIVLTATVAMTGCSTGAFSNTQPSAIAQTAPTRHSQPTQCGTGFRGARRTIYRARVQRATAPNYVYVTEGNVNQMVVYPAGLSNPSPIGYQCFGISPFGVTTDHEGQVYVSIANEGEGQVEIFSDGGGTLIGTLGASNGLKVPDGLTVDSNDNLYVADGGNGYVLVFHHNAKTSFCTLTPGNNYPPMAVATDASDNVYVKLGNGDLGSKYGEFSSGCPQSNAVLLPFSCGYPEGGITVDSAGEVAFGCGDDVEFYAHSGSSWQKSKTLQYTEPVALLTTGPAGELYVPLADGAANSSVNVIPNSAQAPYSITNGVEYAAGAAGGI